MNEKDKRYEIDGKKIGINPNRQAVALTYTPGEQAPKVVAKGQGFVAEKIIQTAEASHVPIHQDENLAGTLSNIELGDFIPPELYEVIAEILVFVDDMERIRSKLY